MAHIQYEEHKFQQRTLDKIESVNEIIADYQEQGFKLTLRQIHYQFVARGLGPNTPNAYRTLGDTIRKGRHAGLIDWDMIEDRTRSLRGLGSYTDPESAIWRAMALYRRDLWVNQPRRYEVWIEKNALIGIIQPVCGELDVDYFTTIGYSSNTALWEASQRHIRYNKEGQDVIVLHMGDHDGEGFDITRDIENKLRLYGASVEVRRIALNMNQVREYNPPPAFSKESSSRHEAYVETHGTDEVWELDALEPLVMADLIRDNVEIDQDRLNETKQLVEREKADLRAIWMHYDEVVELARKLDE